MILSLFSSVFTTLLTLHNLLYHPVFASLPTLPTFPDTDIPITLSIRSDGWTPAPTIAAKAAIVIDERSAEVLFAQNDQVRLPPASTTKMMTALLAIENYDLTQIASISSVLDSDGSSMGLVLGEQILIRDILAGLLVSSANDAADALARMYPGGRSAFVGAMNQRARELGLTNTDFKNPMGYEDQTHVSTARDLAILAREAMRQQEFSNFVRVQSMTVQNIQGTIIHPLRSTNELLSSFQGIDGIKTGWTQEAGECLVAQATRGDQKYIVVVLGSPDRFGETARLLEWAFSNHTVLRRSFSSL